MRGCKQSQGYAKPRHLHSLLLCCTPTRLAQQRGVHPVPSQLLISAPRSVAASAERVLRPHCDRIHLSATVLAPLRKVRRYVSSSLHSSHWTHAGVHFASGRAWPCLRPARRALAAETNRTRSQESLPCHLTRARRGASSRIWLSALQLRVGVKYARARQRNRYRAAATHHYLYIRSSSDRKTQRCCCLARPCC